MKIAFYKKRGVVQGLDLYIANPDEQQEQSDLNFLGYAEIETSHPAFNNGSLQDAHSVRFEPLVIRQAVGKALKTLDIIESFVYVPDPKKGQSLYQNAIIMKTQIGELRKILNSLAV